MDEGQVQKVAKETAKETVREFFILLGVDSTEKDEIKEVSKDFAYLRQFRQGAEAMRRSFRNSVIGVFVLGIAWVLAEGAKNYFHR